MPIYSGEIETAPEGQDIGSLGHTSFGTMLGQTARSALSEGPTAKLLDMGELSAAQGQVPDFGSPFAAAELTDLFTKQPDIDMAAAKARVKEEKLDSVVHLPEQPTMKAGALDIMINRARASQERNAKIAAGPTGFISGAFDVGTSLLVSAVDPLNLAVGFIPVLGEARYGKMLAGAGDNWASRAGVRAGAGAFQGAAFSTAMTPLDWAHNTQEGRDYTMADALHSILYGAGTFGLMHVAGGAGADIYRSIRGRPLYPYGPGEPMERTKNDGRTGQAPRLAAPAGDASRSAESGGAEAADAGTASREGDEPGTGAAAPGDARPDGAAEDVGPSRSQTTVTVNGRTETVSAEWNPKNIAKAMASEEPLNWPLSAGPHITPQDIWPGLPPRVNEDLMRGSLASMIEGESVNAGEMLAAGARHDPKIAEAIEAWHGSPHDFDAFSLEHVGTGEGAQSYGHGVYLAQNPNVAHSYKKSTATTDFIRKARDLYDEFDSPDDAHDAVASSKQFTEPQKKLLAALEKDGWLGFDYPHQAVAAAIRDAKNFEMSPETLDAIKALGNVYRVRLNANKEQFLDWDKPLREQNTYVKNALQRAGLDEDAHGDLQGEGLYHELAPSEESGIHDDGTARQIASRYLHEAGIPGIKYLDNGSRALGRITHDGNLWKVTYREAGEQVERDFKTEAQAVEFAKSKGDTTHNFVVFDDKLIEITHKNGEPVKPVEAVPLQPSPPVSPEQSWRELSERVPFYDKPEVLEASSAAGKLPELESLSADPNKRVTAAQRAAAEAEAEYKLSEPYLPQDLKDAVDHQIALIHLEDVDRAEVLRRGAACLASVAAGAL